MIFAIVSSGRLFAWSGVDLVHVANGATAGGGKPFSILRFKSAAGTISLISRKYLPSAAEDAPSMQILHSRRSFPTILCMIHYRPTRDRLIYGPYIHHTFSMHSLYHSVSMSLLRLTYIACRLWIYGIYIDTYTLYIHIYKQPVYVVY